MSGKLGGWQRLWIVVTALWLAPVAFLAYQERPQATYVAGCAFPSSLDADEVQEVVEKQLIERGAKYGLPTLSPKERERLRRAAPGLAPLDTSLLGPSVAELPEFLLNMSLPEEAKGRDFCRYLMSHLEQSGRAAALQKESSVATIYWVFTFLALWAVPALLLYGLGLSVAWVIRGFRS